MSKYTTEVRFICESKAGLLESAGVGEVDRILEQSWNKIFTSQCEFFDEQYRSVLCKKILKHYYLREIGSETVGVWLLWLNTRLEEIMPYYNQLYKSELLKFEPFNDVDVTRTHEEVGNRVQNTTSDRNKKVDSTGNFSSSQSGSGTSSNKNRFSDTPQGGLNGIESDKYLTNATLDNGTTSSKLDSSGNNSSSDNEVSNDVGTMKQDDNVRFTEKYIGKQGTRSYSDLLMEFRKSMLNVDMQVIKEFENLFMMIW